MRDCTHGQLARSCNICEMEQEIERLRAELAECRSKPQDLYLHANGDPIDCRTCAHVYTDMESYGCKRSATIIVCVNGDGHVPADPVRLYETGGG